MMSLSLPASPATPPSASSVHLRGVAKGDAELARELSADAYVPHIGSLPAHASEEELLDWAQRQQRRHAEGAGFSFTIVETHTDEAVGHCGLWLQELNQGRATAGYSIIASARGRGLAAQRAGYQREGLLRSHQEIAGHRRDMLLYAAIRGDFVPQ